MSKLRDLSPETLAAGVRSGDRAMLARAITCVESDATSDQPRARALLRALLPHAGGAFRLGITGVPGAGKSTFIDIFGTHLCTHGHKVAVLAVDPSSTRTHGSVLGDKTRMEKLARETSAFIRPSPTSGTLGGVARKTRETILLCEAAGFEVILVETVGVGQSEVAVRAMVDFVLMLAVTGTGDELQGIKRGILELADGILVTKADGDNAARAAATQQGFELVRRYLQPSTPGWKTWVATCSALTGDGIPEVWTMLERFRRTVSESGEFDARRRQQTIDAFDAEVESAWRTRWWHDPAVRERRRQLAEKLLDGSIDLTTAAEAMLDSVDSRPDAHR